MQGGFELHKNSITRYLLGHSAQMEPRGTHCHLFVVNFSYRARSVVVASYALRLAIFKYPDPRVDHMPAHRITRQISVLRHNRIKNSVMLTLHHL